jgi:hypothetical protein
MRLLDLLLKAEERGREVAHLEVKRAGEIWEDAQRRIRRKMRIYPRPVVVMRSSSPSFPMVNEAKKPMA